jgi:Flp pilus assembly protein TadD
MRNPLLCRAAVAVGAVLAAAGSVDAAPQVFGRGMEARAGERISLSGRVVLADGTVPADPAEIETICGGQRHMQGRTKSDGGFQIQLGNDPTESMSNARDPGPVGVDSDSFGRAAPGTMDSLGHVDLTACEVRAVLPGFTSTVIQLGRRSAFESPDLGNIILTPYGKDGDPTVSPTTQQAPKEAQKAYEKGLKETQDDKPKWDKAAKDLSKAVELFPKFAEAWYELGEARLHQNEVDKAKEAFQHAIEADANFQKPYAPLSLIELKQGNKEEAARLADKAVSLNPALTEAHFYAAMAHFMLGNLDRAGEAALMVKKQGGERAYPRVLVILGDYFAQKQDFDSSVANYQQYVEIEPDSPMAEQVRSRLAEWKAEGVVK